MGATLPGMTVRGWGSSIAIAAGVAAAAGAAQLGLAYGTGVLTWPASAGTSATHTWINSLTWGCWIAAVSAVVGAVVAARLHDGPHPHRPHAPTEQADPGRFRIRRLTLAFCAAVGALLTVALVAVPARETSTAVATAPQSTAAGYAALGIGVGLLLAIAALTARAVAANLLATATWVWLLAVIVVVSRVVSGDDWAGVPLGFPALDSDPTWFRSILVADAGVALAAALIIGALAALPAARRGDHPVGVVVSGAAGPLTLAVAYLLTQPDLVNSGATALSRHLTAPYLVLAGLAGSLLVSAVPVRREREEISQPPQADTDPTDTDPTGTDADGEADREQEDDDDRPETVPAARTPSEGS